MKQWGIMAIVVFALLGASLLSMLTLGSDVGQQVFLGLLVIGLVVGVPLVLTIKGRRESKALQLHTSQLQLPPLLCPIYHEIPDVVARKLATMDELAQHAFVAEFNERKKSSFLALVLWLLFGLHYAYLGRWWITVVFIFTIGGMGVWWFIDLFRITGMVREYNKTHAITVLRDVQFLPAMNEGL